MANFVRKKKTTLTPQRRYQFTALWMIGCLFGNVFQVYHVTDQYLLYEINTNVIVENEKEIDLPSMIYCIDILSLLKWDDLTEDQIKAVLRGENGHSIVEELDLDKLDI